MKIVFIITARLVSGAEEHLFDLAGRMLSYGIEPVFFIREGDQVEERLKKSSFRYYPVYSVRNKSTFVFKIARALVKEQPDVISVNREHNIYPSLAGFYMALLFLKKRPKLVNVFHTPTSRSYPLLARLFDGIIATSEYTCSSFAVKNPGLRKITTVIHYGIELPELCRTKRDKNRERRILAGRGFPIIGMVGELWKNQEELVEAGVALRKAFPGITIAIVGGGGTDHLEEIIRKHGLERNVVLTGRIPRAQISDLFYDLDLSVSTHRNEGFGIVHIESLAALTPLIAYNSGGLVEIIRNGGGILVNGGTKDLVKTVVELLRDDDRRAFMGNQGRKIVEELFTLEIMAKNHVDYYKKIVREE